MKKILPLIAAAVFSINAPVIVSAADASSSLQIINFNFDSPHGQNPNEPLDLYDGLGANGAPVINGETTQVWNQLSNQKTTGGTLNTIYDSQGDLISGASVTWTSAGTTFNTNPTAFAGTEYHQLMDSYDYAGNKKESITVTGINNGTYTIYIYSQDEKTPGKSGGHGQAQVLNVSVNGGETIAANSGNPDANTFTLGQNYITTTVTVTDGSLVIDYWTPVTEQRDKKGNLVTKGIINGFQLFDPPATSPQPVPEPSTIAYLGIGVALAGFKRLRNKRIEA